MSFIEQLLAVAHKYLSPEARRMLPKLLKRAYYLTVDEVVKRGFHKEPCTIIVEAGNGCGKTRTMCDYVSLIQSMKIFERIYFLNFSQDACQNVVNKLLQNDCKVIWYIVIDKHCPVQGFLNKVTRYAGQHAHACSVCKYWAKYYRHAYMWLKSSLQNPLIKLIEPKFIYFPRQFCTQPIIRAYVLDPNFEAKNSINLDYTPVCVIPSQLFLTHTCILKFLRYTKRQRKPRKYLLIIDEADTIFYKALQVELPELNFTATDYQILRQFSPKSRKLEKLIDLYKAALDLCRDILQNYNYVEPRHVNLFYEIKKKAETLLASFNKRRKQILQYIIDNQLKMNIFLAVSALEEFINITEPLYTFRTVERQNDRYIIVDYSFAVRILLDTAYPFKYFWKIVLSATFPTEEIAKSRFISDLARRAFRRIEKKYKSYINVYITDYTFFERKYGILMRNLQINEACRRLLKCLKEAIMAYHRIFNTAVSGIVIWFGNKFQYRYFINLLRRIGARVYEYSNNARFFINVDGEQVYVLVSYVGSSFARSVDLDNYNISIGLAPLLRPPRNNRYWDTIDYGRAIAEFLQALMRIVRSPRPNKPKLLIIDTNLLSSFYERYYPEWFRELVKFAYIDIFKREVD